MTTELIDPKKVRAEMEEMITMITEPAFVRAMKEMKETPVSKRRELGKRTLTVDALKAQGVKIPDGMRLTTRYFEPGKSRYIEVDPNGNLTERAFPKFRGRDGLGGVVQWGGCACGGGLSFCGGAGGST